MLGGGPLDRFMLSQSRVIAKGRRIRDVMGLVQDYGGTVGGWVKKSSPRLYRGSVSYEYHWYEHRGIGRKELCLVKVSP